MASAILFGLTQKIIENLGCEIFLQIGSVWRVSDDLEKLKITVSILQSVLLDAAEKQNHNRQVGEWLERLKDAVYEANDFLTELTTEASLSGARSGDKLINKVRALLSKSNPVHLKISRKIKKIGKILNEIADERIKFRLEDRRIELHVVSRKRKPTFSFVSEEDVIGRDDEKKALLELLLNPTMGEDVSVIPIVGMGGIGKTTLAQFVYNNEKVTEHFELKMWVSVSDPFELEIIAKKIIESATEKTPPNLELEQLQIKLRRAINHQKYLLVLDDLWNDNRGDWLNLKKLLIGGSKGSKILITTRNRMVAQITRTVSPHDQLSLNCLSENPSWLLFQQAAFSEEQIANDQLVMIGREIVGMCKGLPLAIKSIGHVLYRKETELEWSHVKDDLVANVTTNGNDVSSILKLSYDYLPLYLKCCFAYCSLFPKNYEMDKETIMHLWIAQGFIQSPNKNKQLEDIAEECFKDLFSGSFFEEVKDSSGVIKYKMHDLIHDVAKSVAGAECKLVDLNGENIDAKIRHVSCPFSMNSSFIETLKSRAKAEKIRTFLLTFGEYCSGSIDELMLDMLILSFKSLRALDLHGLEIKTVPNSIEKLIHLRYLDLSWNKSIEILPISITKLRSLQTLKLKGCKKLKELPQDIKELVSLKHLDNGGCYGLSHMPSGLGQMTCFQTLQLFVVSKDLPPISGHIGELKELNLLNNLRGTIEIARLERLINANSESKAANLRGKRHLERLILRWDVTDNLNVHNDEMSLDGLQPNQNLKYLTVYGYGGVIFSSWLSSLTNLVNLMLHTCNRCQHLPQLSQLSSLKHLSLEYMYKLEYISDDDIIEVPASLMSLRITNCPILKRWWRSDFVEEVNNRNDNVVATTSTLRADHQQHQHRPSVLSLPSFPCLSSLSIDNCPHLTFMPLFPHLKESLILNDVNMKPLRQTMAMAMAMASSPPSSASSSLSYPLSKLKSMCLLNIWDIIPLPNEWALKLTSLKRLEIWGCPRLRSLSRAIQYITSLEELWIVNCEEFEPSSDMDDDGMEWRRLNCLQSLTFERLPKLESLPAGLQHVTLLQKLVISNCPNMMTLPSWIKELTSLERLGIDGFSNLTSLPDEISCLRSLQRLIIAGFTDLMAFPEWINNLTSLEQLQILRCPKLTALPNGMSYLSSLQMLKIVGCPQLEKNCEEGFGVDWSEISHVPIVSLSNQPDMSNTSISGMFSNLNP